VFELFETKIQQFVNLNEAELDAAKSYFIPRKLRKRQYLLQNDEACKHLAFVERGVLRSYTLDDKGNEHIIQFAFEGWWISDLYSFYTGEPSIYNIDALEDAELLILTHTGMEAMLEEIPKLERTFRMLIQNSYITLQRRLAGNLSLSAETRYKNFVGLYPDMYNRIPQHMIASFLGVTPETLSRIKKQLLNH
jgi:CRP-like cAMP-binding protein